MNDDAPLTDRADHDHPWYRPGKWWVSPWNFRNEVIGAFEPPPTREVFVVDSTLRSICTSEPGTAVQPDDLVEIARELDAIGVREAVFNISHTGSISDLAYRSARACVNAGFQHLRITSGCVLLPKEWRIGLDKAAEAGIRDLEVSYGATPLAGFTGSPAVYDLLQEAMEYAKTLAQSTSVAFNVHRDTNLDFLLGYVELAARYHPRFLRIYDTKTCLGPQAMAWLVRTIRSHLGSEAPPIVIHTHNSWGLGSATTISGVLAGAQGVDTAVLAVGTKSGHTPMEEVVLALEALYGIHTGLDLSRIDRLTSLVAQVIGIPIHPNKPVVGANAYLCEQGPAVVEALEERLTGRPALTPFASTAIGQSKRVVWGKNTLKPYVMQMKLRELGIAETPDHTKTGLQSLETHLESITSYPAWIEDDLASEIIQRAIAESALAEG